MDENAFTRLWALSETGPNFTPHDAINAVGLDKIYEASPPGSFELTSVTANSAGGIWTVLANWSRRTPIEPMSDWLAFLAAIIERPDDDLPRLIAADWLDENGQPDRAEFIRLQCELARRPAGHCTRECLDRAGNCHTARLPAIRRRIRELWHKPLILRELPDHEDLEITCVIEDQEYAIPRYGIAAVVSRGFVDKVICDPADWINHERRLRQCCPLKRRLVDGKFAPAGMVLLRDPSDAFGLGVFQSRYPEIEFGHFHRVPQATMIGRNPTLRINNGEPIEILEWRG